MSNDQFSLNGPVSESLQKDVFERDINAKSSDRSINSFKAAFEETAPRRRSSLESVSIQRPFFGGMSSGIVAQLNNFIKDGADVKAEMAGGRYRADKSQAQSSFKREIITDSKRYSKASPSTFESCSLRDFDQVEPTSAKPTSPNVRIKTRTRTMSVDAGSRILDMAIQSVNEQLSESCFDNKEDRGKSSTSSPKTLRRNKLAAILVSFEKNSEVSTPRRAEKKGDSNYKWNLISPSRLVHGSSKILSSPSAKNKNESKPDNEIAWKLHKSPRQYRNCENDKNCTEKSTISNSKAINERSSTKESSNRLARVNASKSVNNKANDTMKTSCKGIIYNQNGAYEIIDSAAPQYQQILADAVHSSIDDTDTIGTLERAGATNLHTRLSALKGMIEFSQHHRHRSSMSMYEIQSLRDYVLHNQERSSDEKRAAEPVDVDSDESIEDVVELERFSIGRYASNAIAQPVSKATMRSTIPTLKLDETDSHDLTPSSTEDNDDRSRQFSNSSASEITVYRLSILESPTAYYGSECTLTSDDKDALQSLLLYGNVTSKDSSQNVQNHPMQRVDQVSKSDNDIQQSQNDDEVIGKKKSLYSDVLPRKQRSLNDQQINQKQQRHKRLMTRDLRMANNEWNELEQISNVTKMIEEDVNVNDELQKVKDKEIQSYNEQHNDLSMLILDAPSPNMEGVNVNSTNASSTIVAMRNYIPSIVEMKIKKDPSVSVIDVKSDQLSSNMWWLYKSIVDIGMRQVAFAFSNASVKWLEGRTRIAEQQQKELHRTNFLTSSLSSFRRRPSPKLCISSSHVEAATANKNNKHKIPPVCMDSSPDMNRLFANALTLHEIMSNGDFRADFRRFVNQSHSAESLDFYEAVEAYKTLNDDDERLKCAHTIYTQFINESTSTQPINITFTIRQEIESFIKLNETINDINIITLFDHALHAIVSMLESDVYPRFIESGMYSNMISRLSKGRGWTNGGNYRWLYVKVDRAKGLKLRGNARVYCTVTAATKLTKSPYVIVSNTDDCVVDWNCCSIFPLISTLQCIHIRIYRSASGFASDQQLIGSCAVALEDMVPPWSPTWYPIINGGDRNVLNQDASVRIKFRFMRNRESDIMDTLPILGIKDLEKTNDDDTTHHGDEGVDRIPDNNDVIKKYVDASKLKVKWFREDGYNLNLTYITDRIIAMAFPGRVRKMGLSDPHNAHDICDLLDRRHPSAYKVYNLCAEQTYALSTFKGRVVNCPIAYAHCCPIDMIITFCDDIHQWLESHPQNVAVVHSNKGLGRTAFILSCYHLFKQAQPNPHIAVNAFVEKRFGCETVAMRDRPIILRNCHNRYLKYMCCILMHHNMKDHTLLPNRQLCLESVRIVDPKLKDFRVLREFGFIVRPLDRTIDDAQIFSKLTYYSDDVATMHKGDGMIEMSCGRLPVLIKDDVRLSITVKGVFKQEEVMYAIFNTRFIDVESKSSRIEVFRRQDIDVAGDGQLFARWFSHLVEIECAFTLNAPQARSGETQTLLDNSTQFTKPKPPVPKKRQPRVPTTIGTIK